MSVGEVQGRAVGSYLAILGYCSCFILPALLGLSTELPVTEGSKLFWRHFPFHFPFSPLLKKVILRCAPHLYGKPALGAAFHYQFCFSFLKILALYMLWRAQFLSECYAVFCVHQILVLLPLRATIWDQKVSQNIKILISIHLLCHTGWW